jgi:SHS2 domain-containing protein
MYEVFEHTADLGLRVRAPTLEALLVDAAHGLFSLMVVNLRAVQAVQERSIRIRGNAFDYLLLDWLNELLFIFDTERLVFCRYEIRLAGKVLQATCHGETLDIVRHVTDHEVKAITYHGLRVEQHADNWLAEVVVDI